MNLSKCVFSMNRNRAVMPSVLLVLKLKLNDMKNKNYQETRTITEVTENEDYYFISQDGIYCGLKKKYGVKPVIGDKLTAHRKGGAFGTIRGIDLNGKRIFWKTDKDLEIKRLEWLRKNEEEKQQRFKDADKFYGL